MSIEDTVLVLRTTNLRESDKIISLLGKEHGKFQGLARGVRRSKKRFPSGIDIFDFGHIVLEASRRNRQNLSITEFRKTHRWNNLSASVASYSHASLCSEVVDQLSQEEDPDSKQLFPVLFSSLKAIDKSTEEKERSAISCFLILSALSSGGFLSVDELPNCSISIREWYGAMLAASAPIKPFDETLAHRGLGRAVELFCGTAERKLNSWDAVQTCLPQGSRK
jgi:DNA repair protein RecO (recombination protein O)